MDRRLIVTAFALALVIAGSAAFARRSAEEPTAPLNEEMSGVQIDPEPPEEEEPAVEVEYTYLLREYEGRVAIFPYADDSEPEIVLDTLVKFLPDYDRSQMQEGIPVKDYRELVSLIEDYIS